jgi:hypothetical protein
MRVARTMRLIDATNGVADRAISGAVCVAKGEAAGALTCNVAGERFSMPELRELVIEATRALAGLDVPRLEDLALSCRALTQSLPPRTAAEQEEFSRQARAARDEMTVFARVLEATRANVKVMERLRELRAGKARYLRGSECYPSFSPRDQEDGHGND